MPLLYSQWMYGFEVFDSGPNQNNKLDFINNGTTYQGGTAASIAAGVYTPDELAAQVQSAMRAATTNTQPSCSFNYATLKFTVSGTATFSILFGTGTEASIDCNGLLGFNAADKTTLTSYTSDQLVGTAPSTASLWTAAEPQVMNSPVIAQPAGTAAQLAQRQIRLAQNISDGMTVESIYFGQLKKVRVSFTALLASEQTNMESFLNWIVQGKRFTWQPDKTSTNVLKLVAANPGEIADAYEWMTRPEVSYGSLTFYEQLS